jgi:hypothetical protein
LYCLTSWFQQRRDIIKELARAQHAQAHDYPAACCKPG